MAVVTVVNGSPHPEGFTSGLVERLVDGIEAAGARADVITLRDYQIEPCVNTPGWPCWPDGPCTHVEDDTPQVKARVEAGNGLVIACPVYWSSITGLTKNFVDKMRLSGFEGEPALAVTMAGGSGNGMVLAVRALHGFFGWGWPPLSPLPVSRFNYEQVLETAEVRGRQIAEAAEAGPRPFTSTAERWRWELSLPFADWQLLEEKLYLAGLVVENAPEHEGAEEEREQAERALAAARRLAARGELAAAADDIATAYECGRAVWRAAK